MMLEHDADCEARAWIVRVKHVIPAIHIINVHVVGVVPAYRPRVNESKPIAAVLKARISAHHNRVADAELVVTAKIGVETLVRNSIVASSTEAKRWLGALCGLFLLRVLVRL